MGAPRTEWEELGHHLANVAQAASDRAAAFGWADAARIAGLLHDIGKASREFQAYIADPVAARARVDHSTAGAREAARFGPQLGKMLAFIIAGHHAGLADGTALQRRLDAKQTPIPSAAGWEQHVSLPKLTASSLPSPDSKAGLGLTASVLIRMLFSCLVDADFIETETFYGPLPRGGFATLETLGDRLRTHLARFETATGDVNAMRARVLAHVTAQADSAPGLFTLTVPTGGGKTLTSLSFALEHARRHGLRRVVYVIPFTSIIEQTAAVFRHALATEDDVLEHHASFDWDRAVRSADPAAADAGEGPDGLGKLRRAAENWDAPVVVTTAVQFFESLHANRPSRCRKLHNLTRSVIVLDEAQTLPLPLLRPCLAMLDQLARNYGASVVLCTATQPAIRRQDGFKGGLDIPPDRELAPDPAALYAALPRVQVEVRQGPTEDAVITDAFAAAEQMRCIVNSRAHARELFERIRLLDGATHLTTLMCPRHRRAVLKTVRTRLKAGEPVRLVATSLIEAGVDIDLPVVWRALAGLDQIAQAAGRCNREGRHDTGHMVVFTPAEHPPPRSLRLAAQEAGRTLQHHPNPRSREAVLAYFQGLYWAKGEGAFDAATLDDVPYPILDRIAERTASLDFPFETVARVFRMIDEAMESIIVPYDAACTEILTRIARADRPGRDDLRRLQQYVVPIPAAARQAWFDEGELRPVHAALGDSVLTLRDRRLYDEATGLALSAGYRSAEENIV